MMVEDGTGPTPQEQNELMDKLLPWFTDFCAANDFFRKDGREFVSRGMSLCMGNAPRTRKERDFTVKALAEIARRWPGASYPALCIPPASNTAHLNRVQ